MVIRLVLGALLLLALPYARTAVYRFPDPRPFTGSMWFNPYAGGSGTWQRANLHAHGRAWGGLTNGRQPARDIVRRYRGIGYDVTGVSDYHHITRVEGVELPAVYEHGYNLAKAHRVVVGADRVAWFDFPLWQGRSHKQLVIDAVASTADLVVLAHPATGYSRDDLASLAGYHALEIVNGPHPAMAWWDAALSSGHPVWGIANDDTHDLRDQGRLGVAWTMIDAASASPQDIIAALRAGRAYAVWRNNRGASAVDSWLAGVAVTNDTLSVSITGEPATFLFIGQNGAVRRTVRDALRASYGFAPDDTYIRTVIQTPRTELFLNPVFRYDGEALPAPRPTVDAAGTWALRGGSIATLGGVWLLWRRRRAERRAPVAVRVTAQDGRPA
jgi:hypothetical protein